MALFGLRTGVYTLIKLVGLLCHLYETYKPSIDAWILAVVPEANRTTVQQFVGLIIPVCGIIKHLSTNIP